MNIQSLHFKCLTIQNFRLLNCAAKVLQTRTIVLPTVDSPTKAILNATCFHLHPTEPVTLGIYNTPDLSECQLAQVMSTTTKVRIYYLFQISFFLDRLTNFIMHDAGLMQIFGSFQEHPLFVWSNLRHTMFEHLYQICQIKKSFKMLIADAVDPTSVSDSYLIVDSVDSKYWPRSNLQAFCALEKINAFIGIG
jgi:hypothetical protein